MTDRQTADKEPGAFRTISEVAEYLDVPQHVLRFWETRFNQIKPLKRGGGRRFYRPEDVLLIRGIRHLLYGEGYTIKGVQRILKEEGVRFVQQVGVDDAAGPLDASGRVQVASAEQFEEQGWDAEAAARQAEAQASHGRLPAMRPQPYASAVSGDERVASPPVAQWSSGDAPYDQAPYGRPPYDEAGSTGARLDTASPDPASQGHAPYGGPPPLEPQPQNGASEDYAQDAAAAQDYGYVDAASHAHAAVHPSIPQGDGYSPAPAPDYGAAYDLAEAKREQGRGELAAHSSGSGGFHLAGPAAAGNPQGQLYGDVQQDVRPTAPRLTAAERAQLQAALGELLECRRLLAHARGELDEPG